MSVHQAFDDSVLGLVNWNANEKCWEFDAGPIYGRSIEASYYPANIDLPVIDQGWDGVRSCTPWIRTNTSKAQQFLAERLYQGWMDDLSEVETDNSMTFQMFQDKLKLQGITFYEDQIAQLIFEDGGLFGGHAFCLQLNSDGEFVGEPDMFG